MKHDMGDVIVTHGFSVGMLDMLSRGASLLISTIDPRHVRVAIKHGARHSIREPSLCAWLDTEPAPSSAVSIERGTTVLAIMTTGEIPTAKRIRVLTLAEVQMIVDRLDGELQRELALTMEVR